MPYRSALSIAALVAVATACTTAKTPDAPTEGTATASAPALDPVARGAYIVNTVGGCNDCHTPKVFGPQGPMLDTTRRLAGHPADEPVPAVPDGVLGPGAWGGLASGGLTAWAGPWGVSFASNLTPDETGLKAWTANDFIATMRTGKHMGTGRNLLPPMPWQPIGHATDEDLRAIFAYLQSLPPVKNQVPMPIPPKG